MFKRVGILMVANVRQKLRELGQLSIHLRNQCSVLTFEDAINPKHFDGIVTANWEIAGSVESSDNSLTQKRASKHSLNRLAELKRGSAIRNGDDIARKEAGDYILLHKKQTLGEERKTLSTWRDLAQVILSRGTIFNKGRGGEVGQMSLTMNENRIERTTVIKKLKILFNVGLNSSNELEWLANHMGHGLAVHKHFYRLREQTLELAEVSKLLIATDDGQAYKFVGKSLDEINLEGNRIVYAFISEGIGHLCSPQESSVLDIYEAKMTFIDGSLRCSASVLSKTLTNYNS
ncbi:hypothetical protein KUTeg_010623 [Tegillarca granosa]|uniref:Uncharacterized protein n=1 Tax=Tegillarca granosa TaxID=220873 RepID=A0ABQ9F325_TEGGR|nr:hypothetical protein KUTeg_010623 [Tegillarca granosa]